MKFTFLKKESLLYDLFMFPKLALITEEDIKKANEPLHDNDSAKVLDDPDHIAFVKKAKADLEAFHDPLLGFYADEMASSYDFPYLLFNAYSLRNFHTHEDYLDHIMNEPEDTIKRKLLHSLLTVEESGGTPITDKEVDTLLNSKEKLLNQIRNITTTENYKWTLLILIENPLKYLELFRGLLDDIKPFFDTYKNQHMGEIEQFEDTIIKELNRGQEDAFNALTHQMIPAETLEEENLVFTSFVHPYSFSIQTFGGERFMFFGLRMKKGFEEVAKFQQNVRQNRAKVFKTLSDNTRYEVLRHIARGITSTKDIASSLGVSSATITYHINAFITANIVRIPKSKKQRYEVDFERLETFWNEFMDDLKNQ